MQYERGLSGQGSQSSLRIDPMRLTVLALDTLTGLHCPSALQPQMVAGTWTQESRDRHTVTRNAHECVTD